LSSVSTHLTRRQYARDEGRRFTLGDVAYPPKCTEKRPHLSGAVKVLLTQEECPRSALEQRNSLERVARDVEILGEHDPSTPRHLGEPLHILCSGREAVVVQLYSAPGASKRIRE